MKYLTLILVGIIVWQYLQIAYLKKYTKLLAKELELERRGDEQQPGVEQPKNGKVITIEAANRKKR